MLKVPEPRMNADEMACGKLLLSPLLADCATIRKTL